MATRTERSVLQMNNNGGNQVGLQRNILVGDRRRRFRRGPVRYCRNVERDTNVEKETIVEKRRRKASEVVQYAIRRQSPTIKFGFSSVRPNDLQLEITCLHIASSMGTILGGSPSYNRGKRGETERQKLRWRWKKKKKVSRLRWIVVQGQSDQVLISFSPSFPIFVSSRFVSI